jgi:hypothetical protein
VEHTHNLNGQPLDKKKSYSRRKSGKKRRFKHKSKGDIDDKTTPSATTATTSDAANSNTMNGSVVNGNGEQKDDASVKAEATTMDEKSEGNDGDTIRSKSMNGNGNGSNGCARGSKKDHRDEFFSQAMSSAPKDRGNFKRAAAAAAAALIAAGSDTSEHNDTNDSNDGNGSTEGEEGNGLQQSKTVQRRRKGTTNLDGTQWISLLPNDGNASDSDGLTVLEPGYTHYAAPGTKLVMPGEQIMSVEEAIIRYPQQLSKHELTKRALEKKEAARLAKRISATATISASSTSSTIEPLKPTTNTPHTVGHAISDASTRISNGSMDTVATASSPSFPSPTSCRVPPLLASPSIGSPSNKRLFVESLPKSDTRLKLISMSLFVCEGAHNK